jgi:hypothetical protein
VDFEGGTAFAEYSDFRLGTEEESYKLNVGAYRGNAGNGGHIMYFSVIVISHLVAAMGPLHITYVI